MKVLKVIGLVLAKIALVITVLLFMISLTASFVLENGISSLLMSGLPNVGESVQQREFTTDQVVSSNGLNNNTNVDLEGVYNQVLEDLGITEEQLMRILESPLVKDLVNEFVDTVLEDISTGDTSDFNLGEKVLDFVEDNKKEIEEIIGEELPMEKIEEFAKSEEVNEFNKQYQEAIEAVSGNIPAPVKGIVNAIEKFISKDFRNICLIISTLLLVVIALLQWSLYKWIRTLGNTIWGCGLFIFTISIFGNFFSALLTSMIGLGGALQFGKALSSSAISIGIGVGLVVVYALIKKFAKGGKNNEISQNAI